MEGELRKLWVYYPPSSIHGRDGRRVPDLVLKVVRVYDEPQFTSAYSDMRTQYQLHIFLRPPLEHKAVVKHMGNCIQHW